MMRNWKKGTVPKLEEEEKAMQALDRAQAIDHYNAMQRHWEKKQKTMPSYYTNYYEWQIRAFNKVRE